MQRKFVMCAIKAKNEVLSYFCINALYRKNERPLTNAVEVTSRLSFGRGAMDSPMYGGDTRRNAFRLSYLISAMFVSF
jgi:hypothetical protein